MWWAYTSSNKRHVPRLCFMHTASVTLTWASLLCVKRGHYDAMAFGTRGVYPSLGTLRKPPYTVPNVNRPPQRQLELLPQSCSQNFYSGGGWLSPLFPLSFTLSLSSGFLAFSPSLPALSFVSAGPLALTCPRGPWYRILTDLRPHYTTNCRICLNLYVM